jgi:diacylglycerol O-acyltransferase / wax synthase
MSEKEVGPADEGALMVSGSPGWNGVSLYTGRPGAPVHTIAVVIIDGSAEVSHQRLGKLLASSLPQMARFRSRLVGKPLGLGQPVWAEIKDYDPTPQVHTTAVPGANARHQFTELIGGLAAGTLDRLAPLWEAWSIEGLEAGRWALAVKMSPAIINDTAEAVASVWARLLSTDTHNDPKEIGREPSLGALPSVTELVTGTMLELFENSALGASLVTAAVPAVLRAARRRLRVWGGPGPSQEASSIGGTLPTTVFNVPLTPRRAVAFASIRLSHLKTIAHAFGGSVTNVALAACTLGLRTWLRHHDSLTDRPLVMQVPPALFDADSTSGVNLSMPARIGFPVHIDDPVQVLVNLHSATETLTTTSERAAGLGVDFSRLASLLPPSALQAGVALSTLLPWWQPFTPACHGIVSYVPGPLATSYCAGARVVGMHTVAPLVDGCGLSVTLTRHSDVMDLTLCVCPDRVPSVDDIATGIIESVDILLAAAQQSPRGQGPSVITRLAERAKSRRRDRP